MSLMQEDEAPGLETSLRERTASLRTAAEAAERAFVLMLEGRIAPDESGAQVVEDIAHLDLDSPLGLVAAIEEASGLMERGDLLSAHSRCFGFFNPTASWAGVLADFLSAARNPQLCVSSHASASVAIERRMIAWLNRAIGFPPEAGGHFTSGGSEANATGLQVALERVAPEYNIGGAAALPGPIRIYASADSHLAWIKLARSAGLGAQAVRLGPTNGQGVMDVAALSEMINEDRSAGALPVMIAATAGTTNAGMIDPLHACADLAASERIHLHVDAAWAGGLVVDPARKAEHLDGVERADSVTIDAHKWLATPMGAGMVFVKHRAALARAFAVQTDYMPVGDGDDLYFSSIQWSRRFIGLRLWVTLRAYGAAGYRQMFDRQFALADRLRTALRREGWRIRNQSALPVVLFDDPAGPPTADIARWLEVDGRTWLGHVKFEGAPALRACMTSYLTKASDIDVLMERLSAARLALS